MSGIDTSPATLHETPVATPTDAAITVRGLRKTYGRTEALRNVDLTVPRNSVFGFLGPNGAGKSTTMKVLVGLIRPTAGSAEVAGRDVRREGVAARARIGYLPQDAVYWRHLAVRDVLRFTARRYLTGSRRHVREQVDATLELAGLERLARRKVGKLSGGERQRLGVAQAWIGRPEVLILDEPSAGLDPEGRHEVLSMLDALRADATIFYSTHILDDVERISDEIAILDRGRIVASGSTESFLTAGAATYSVAADGEVGDAFDRLARELWASSVTTEGPQRWEITVDDRSAAEHALLRLLVGEHGVRVTDLRPARRSLEDIYLELLGTESPPDEPSGARHDG